MRLDDWCCLGRTVPEESKKYGRKVCSVGYSAELRQFVRVYPLPVQSAIHQRSVCTLELGRNQQDSRAESWRLAREREADGIVAVGEQMPKAKLLSWFARHQSPSIAHLNQQRLSVGVLKVPTETLRHFFANRDDGDPVDAHQRGLFDDLDEQFGSQAIRLAPYLVFDDKEGYHHRLQLREWGCYEFLRKHPGVACQLWENLHFNDEDADVWLVVGNLSNARTAWMVISCYVQHREATLFDRLPAEEAHA